MDIQPYLEIKKIIGKPDLILCCREMFSFLKEKEHITDKNNIPYFDKVRVVITEQIKENKIMLFYNDRTKDSYTINIDK